MAQDDYKSRISTAPGGIGTLQLGPQAYLDARDQRYVHDAYQYFLNQQGGQSALPGGTPAATVQDPTTMIPQTGGSEQAGITAASAAQNMGGGAQNPLTQMITTPTGETMTVKQAFTGNDAYAIPGQMPKTPVSGAWGPQDYLQPETSDPFLMSGAAGGARLSAEQQDPSFWERAKNDFLATGKDIGNTFKSLVDQGIDISKMAGSAILNFIQPGLGLAMQAIPKETPIDKFNQEYALGGDLYQNVVSQVDDPNFEGRLQNYSSDLSPGQNIPGKDPFGINTVSMLGDYPAYATKTYNEIVAKEKAGKELSQFDKDRKEYYGHVSGLTGKTNIPGTPLMVDSSPLKTFPEDTTILPEEKLVTGVTKPGTLASDKWNKLDTSEVNIPDDYFDTSTLPKGPPSVLNPYDPKTLATDKWDTGAFTDYDIDVPTTTEYSTTRPSGIDAVAPSDFGEDVDFEQGFLDEEPTVTTPTYTSPARPHGGDGEGPRNIDTTPKDTPSGPPPGGPHGDGGGSSGPSTTPSAPPGSGGMSGSWSPAAGGGGGGGGNNSCFLKGTQVTMADGTTKPVEQVDLGDEVAVGGKVFAVGRFLNNELHDYKGIKVSGSHMVNEDGNWVRVEDSKHGKPLGDDEHTVYVFGAENRRILINNILFTDYFEVKEQEKLSEGDKFFDNWKLHAKVDSDNNVNVLNAS